MNEGSGLPGMDEATARIVEDQLHSLQRQQAERNHPLPLPRPDFWHQVGRVLDFVETELNELIRTEGHSQRVITATRRQANIRRAMADLARKRLGALLNHSVTQNLRGSTGMDVARLNPLDWSRHDPHEREFCEGLATLLTKFKLNVNWEEMILGTGETPSPPQVPVGTTQLDEFVPQPGGLTGHGPPPLELEAKHIAEYEDPEMDEEERISRMEAYPEMMDQAREEIPVEVQSQQHRGAAWELAPGVSKITLDASLPMLAEVEEGGQDVEVSNAEGESVPKDEGVSEEAGVDAEEVIEDSTLSRIRIIVGQEEPVLTADGEIDLQVGDVHMLNADMATYLIEAGVAESAAL